VLAVGNVLARAHVLLLGIYGCPPISRQQTNWSDGRGTRRGAGRRSRRSAVSGHHSHSHFLARRLGDRRAPLYVCIQLYPYASSCICCVPLYLTVSHRLKTEYAQKSQGRADADNAKLSHYIFSFLLLFSNKYSFIRYHIDTPHTPHVHHTHAIKNTHLPNLCLLYTRNTPPKKRLLYRLGG